MAPLIEIESCIESQTPEQLEQEEAEMVLAPRTTGLFLVQCAENAYLYDPIIHHLARIARGKYPDPDGVMVWLDKVSVERVYSEQIILSIPLAE